MGWDGMGDDLIIDNFRLREVKVLHMCFFDMLLFLLRAFTWLWLWPFPFFFFAFSFERNGNVDSIKRFECSRFAWDWIIVFFVMKMHAQVPINLHAIDQEILF